MANQRQNPIVFVQFYEEVIDAKTQSVSQVPDGCEVCMIRVWNREDLKEPHEFFLGSDGTFHFAPCKKRRSFRVNYECRAEPPADNMPTVHESVQFFE